MKIAAAAACNQVDKDVIRQFVFLIFAIIFSWLEAGVDSPEVQMVLWPFFMLATFLLRFVIACYLFAKVVLLINIPLGYYFAVFQ